MAHGLVGHVILFAAPDAEASIEAGEFERWIVAKERVAAPGLVVLCAFEKETVMARCAQRAHDFDGREGICHDLMAERDAADRFVLCDRFHFRKGWVHGDSFFGGKKSDW